MRYASIRSMDISNGEGLGVALFVQGCHFHCHNCFNPDTWDFSQGKEWNEKTKDIFIGLALKTYISRISILGGEPLADENVSEVYQLLDEIKKKMPNKKIWLYSGYTLSQILQADETQGDKLRKKCIELVDFFVDGQFIEDLKDLSLKFRGSSNQNIWHRVSSEFELYCI